MSLKDKLIEKVKQNEPDMSMIEIEIAVDELVHNLKSQEASEITNCGMDSQLKYIFRSYLSPGVMKLRDLEDRIIEDIFNMVGQS